MASSADTQALPSPNWLIPRPSAGVLALRRMAPEKTLGVQQRIAYLPYPPKNTARAMTTRATAQQP